MNIAPHTTLAAVFVDGTSYLVINGTATAITPEQLDTLKRSTLRADADRVAHMLLEDARQHRIMSSSLQRRDDPAAAPKQY